MSEEEKKAIEDLKKKLSYCELEYEQNGSLSIGKFDAIKEAIIVISNLQKENEDLNRKRLNGTLSDGYHTYNDLYYQRCILFATICNSNKNISWKSKRHNDGKKCFDSDNWFIVGIDTPNGSYTYHYEIKYWDLFEVQELKKGKEWDGHTEKDVTRLLSLEKLTKNLQKENEELHKEINQRIKLKLENEKTADDLYNKIKILQKELDKKDKVINYIAKHTYIRTGENGVLGTITEEVIEHFYKKAEEENE